MECEHAHMTRQTNDAQYQFMSSYKQGFRPFICDQCGDIFWVRPLAIVVNHPEGQTCQP